jgi:predicted nucleic acid-binding protein
VIVVDTSVLIAFLKGARTPAAERFAQIEENGVPFAIPVFCFQELLQGARDQREWRVLDKYLATQRILPAEEPLDLHREAARIFFDGRRRGLTIRSTIDCVIAAQTLRAGATLLHDDSDFDRIAKIRPLKTVRG